MGPWACHGCTKQLDALRASSGGQKVRPSSGGSRRDPVGSLGGTVTKGENMGRAGGAHGSRDALNAFRPKGRLVTGVASPSHGINMDGSNHLPCARGSPPQCRIRSGSPRPEGVDRCDWRKRCNGPGWAQLQETGIAT